MGNLHKLTDEKVSLAALAVPQRVTGARLPWRAAAATERERGKERPNGEARGRAPFIRTLHIPRGEGKSERRKEREGGNF